MSYNTTYPKEHSLAARCLARMLTGETLTHRNADNAAGSYRLASFIHYLCKQHHWIFNRQEFPDDTRDPVGRSATYMQYSLPKELIQWAGEEGQRYASEVLGLEAKRIARRVAATTHASTSHSKNNSSGHGITPTSRFPTNHNSVNNGGGSHA